MRRDIPWKKLEEACSYFKSGNEFTPQFQRGQWDGVTRLFKNGRFPTGLLSIVKGLLEIHDIEYTISLDFEWPERRFLDWNISDEVLLAKERYVEALQSVYVNKRGMLQLPTRFGKTTVVASSTIAMFGVPTLFIAHQLDLIYDAKKIFEQFIHNVGEVGVIGGGEYSFRPLTVACIDSLANKLKTDPDMYKYLHNTVKYVIVDETQYYGPGEYKDVLSTCMAPYRMFMSATVERSDGADLELQAASGDIIYQLSEEDMIIEGYISDVDVEMIPYDHKLYNKSATGVKYTEFYDAVITYNEARNKLIVDEVCSLLKDGRPTIVIVRRIDHGKLLEAMLRALNIRLAFVYGDIEAEDRILMRDKFNAGEYDVLIGSTVFDTAIDLHRASGLVLAASGSSKIRAPQRVGRILSQVMGKVARVKDIRDLNVKYFEEDAKDREFVYRERYGERRLRVRGVKPITEIEKLFGINSTAMFDRLR